MKLLLDTCTFLWMVDAVENLSPEARECLEDGRNELILHQASSWEIQLKYQTGKLALHCPPQKLLADGHHGRAHGRAGRKSDIRASAPTDSFHPDILRNPLIHKWKDHET